MILNASDPLTFYERAESHRRAGRFSAAVADYGTYMAMAPDDHDPAPYLNCAMALRQLGRLDEAIDRIQTAIALEPTLPTAHYNLGNCLQAALRLEEAVACYTRAIELDPDYPDVHHQRGDTLYRLGRSEAATADFDIAIQQRPDRDDTYYLRALAQGQAGHLDAAIQDIDHLLGSEPDAIALQLYRARLQTATGRPGDAVEGLQRTVQSHASVAEVQQTLAEALEARGDSDAAADARQRASDLREADSPAGWRAVRVFVSSTFRDMQRERDVLVKRVFPELRRRCLERRVELVELDLRWGITREQAERDEVLPICLSEVQRCRPFFLGLLGERYGWVPERLDDELVARWPWLRKYDQRSVTELEIVHGVLRKAADAALFYFRSPHYVEQLPESDRDIARAESDTAAARQEALRERIRASGCLVREGYDDVNALGEQIIEDLWALIDKAYPADAVPDSFSVASAEQQAAAQRLRRVYVPRETEERVLDDFAARETPPLVVLGPAGSGKSALLANWTAHYQAQHPEALVLLFNAAASDARVDTTSFVHWVTRGMLAHASMSEIAEGETLLAHATADPLSMMADLIEAFRDSIRLVIVCDGLEHFESNDASGGLAWLPPQLPPNVKVILSGRSSVGTAAAAERGWPVLTLPPLDALQQERLATQYLAGYGKSLDSEHLQSLLSSPRTSVPRFLVAVLEELRVAGTHELLGELLAGYLRCEDLSALYSQVLTRLERDFETVRSGLIGDVLALLASASEGLAEAEILELLTQSEEPLPAALWSPIALALDGYFGRREARLYIADPELRSVVVHRYLASETAREERLQAIAAFFASAPASRRATERVAALTALGHKEALREELLHEAIFLYLYQNDRATLMAAWRVLEGEANAFEDYQARFSEQWHPSPDEDLASAGDSAHALAGYFHVRGEFEASEHFYSLAIEYEREAHGADAPRTLASLGNFALMLGQKGDAERAITLAREAAVGSERHFGLEHPQTIAYLRALANALLLDGQSDAGVEMLQLALSASEKVHGPAHPQTLQLKGTLASAHGSGEDTAEAELKEIWRQQRDTLGAEHPDTLRTQFGLARAMFAHGQVPAATTLALNVLTVQHETLGADHPETQGTNEWLRRQRDGLVNGFQHLLGSAEPSASLPTGQALLAMERVLLGDDHDDTLRTLNTCAELAQQLGDFDEARRCMEEAAATRLATAGPFDPATLQAQLRLANLALDSGDDNEALSRFALLAQNCEWALGEDDERTQTFKRSAWQLLEAVLSEEDHNFCSEREARIEVLADTDPASAAATQSEVVQLQSARLGPTHPVVARSWLNLSYFSRQAGQIDAPAHLFSAVEGYEASAGARHPAVIQFFNDTLDQAGELYNAGQTREAAAVFRRMLSFIDRNPGHDPEGKIKDRLLSLIGHQSDKPAAASAEDGAEAEEEKLGLGCTIVLYAGLGVFAVLVSLFLIGLFVWE
jgi:nephrocystin-3